MSWFVLTSCPLIPSGHYSNKILSLKEIFRAEGAGEQNPDHPRDLRNIRTGACDQALKCTSSPGILVVVLTFLSQASAGEIEGG